ncbi:MAG TPA: hypothetical protein VFY93_07605 [Planctomycetota bacterium]|nr:hypothetical protein [Planctomycetota bacterium]
MRSILAAFLPLALLGTALAEDPASPKTASPTLADLLQDTAKKKEIAKALKMLDQYFKAEADEKKSNRNANKQAEAEEDFLGWLAGTADSVGMDLRAHPDIVIDMLDQARIKYLESKYRKGSLEYVKVSDAKGMKRHEYAILVPPTYDPNKSRIPVVVSLHGRVINPRHPAFRSAPFDERARYVIWNNWFKTPAANDVLVVAPTTNPDGFQFTAESHYDDLQALFRTLIEALSEYRGDWDRIFLEVHGKALRVACEQSLVFAGIIVRDRVDDRKGPLLDPEEFFLLENLNGIPLVYVADAENWANVGKPTADALTAAYGKAGMPQNLVVIQAKRDVDGALRGGEPQIQAFLATHVRPKTRESFTWRFAAADQVQPFPVLGIEANFNFNVNDAARKAPLADKAGRMAFKVRRETVEGQDVNRIEIDITEAEGLKLALSDPLINLDLPVTLTVNGVATDVTKKKYERDWKLFFDNVLPGRYFMLPMLSTLEVAFPLKPQFVAPEEKPAEGADGAAGKKPADEQKPAEGMPADAEKATGK